MDVLVILLAGLAGLAFIIYALTTKPPQSALSTTQPPSAPLRLTKEQEARVRDIAARVGETPEATLQKMLVDSTIRVQVTDNDPMPPQSGSLTIVQMTGLILAADLVRHPGFVYFIETVNPPHRLKIGWAYDPHDRLKQLQTGSPDSLRLIGARVGSKDDERALQQRFAGLRLGGEWFTDTPDLRVALGLPPRPANVSPT